MYPAAAASHWHSLETFKPNWSFHRDKRKKKRKQGISQGSKAKWKIRSYWVCFVGLGYIFPKRTEQHGDRWSCGAGVCGFLVRTIWRYCSSLAILNIISTRICNRFSLKISWVLYINTHNTHLQDSIFCTEVSFLIAKAEPRRKRRIFNSSKSNLVFTLLTYSFSSIHTHRFFFTLILAITDEY